MKMIRIEMLVPEDASNDDILERAQQLALDIQHELYEDDDSMSEDDIEHDDDLISNSVSVQTVQESV